MGAIRMLGRAHLRRKLWGAVAAVALAGIAGGAVLGALAGARRTDSAFPRLLDSLHSADVLVFPRQFEKLDAKKIAALPTVAQVSRGLGFGFTGRKPDGSPSLDFSTGALASEDGRAIYDVERLRVLHGRMPDPSRADEILVNETIARDLHLHVGSAVPASIFNFDAMQQAPQNMTPQQQLAYFTPVDLEVTGIGRGIDELLSNQNQDQGVVVLTPAFARAHPKEVSYAIAAVRLRHGAADVKAFEDSMRRALPDVQFQFTSREGRLATFAGAVRPYVDSLRLFAAVAALAGFFIVLQALLRLVGSDAEDSEKLDALGATRVQRAAVSLNRAVIAAVGGAVLAVVIVVAISPMFPLGVARHAEPAPGVRVDGIVIGLGVAVILVMLLGPCVFVVWRRARLTSRVVDAGPGWHPSRRGGATCSGERTGERRQRRPVRGPA